MRQIKNLSNTESIRVEGVRIQPNSVYNIPIEEEKAWVLPNIDSLIDSDVIAYGEDGNFTLTKDTQKELLREATNRDAFIIRSNIDQSSGLLANNYSTVASFKFKGVSVYGDFVKIVYDARVQSNNNLGSLRIYDVTNNVVVFEHYQAVNSNQFSSYSGILNKYNLPDEEADFEIQVYNHTNAKRFYLRYFELRY